MTNSGFEVLLPCRGLIHSIIGSSEIQLMYGRRNFSMCPLYFTTNAAFFEAVSRRYGRLSVISF